MDGSICTPSELQTYKCTVLVPNYNLAGDPLELPQGPHFENHCPTLCLRFCSIKVDLVLISQSLLLAALALAPVSLQLHCMVLPTEQPAFTTAMFIDQKVAETLLFPNEHIRELLTAVENKLTSATRTRRCTMGNNVTCSLSADQLQAVNERETG